MRKRVSAWVLLFLCLLLLSFSATPYSNIANLALISVRVVLLAMVSILTLRERWIMRNNHHNRAAVVQRMRRWYYGEQEKP